MAKPALTSLPAVSNYLTSYSMNTKGYVVRQICADF